MVVEKVVELGKGGENEAKAEEQSCLIKYQRREPGLQSGIWNCRNYAIGGAEEEGQAASSWLMT